MTDKISLQGNNDLRRFPQSHVIGENTTSIIAKIGEEKMHSFKLMG